MDLNEILISVIPAIISGITSYFISIKQSNNKIALLKESMQNDLEKMKIKHQQELEKIKISQNNKKDDYINELTYDIIKNFTNSINANLQ